MSEKSREVLKDWEPCMVEFYEPNFNKCTFVKRTVPGWECKHCGTLYGSVLPPGYCWKCKEAEQK